MVVTDALFGLSESIASLGVGASESFTESYTITQADLDAGSVLNSASASGNDPDGNPVDDDDEVTVEAERQASLSVDKSASPLSYDAAGDVITYTITVTNTVIHETILICMFIYIYTIVLHDNHDMYIAICV